MSDTQVQRTYWETSRVEKRRSTLGRGVSAPVAQRKGARKKPLHNARSEDAQHHRQEQQQQRKPAQQDALKLVPENTYSQQAPWENGSRNVTGSRMKSAPRMAPLLGPIHASARLQDESEGDLPCYRLGTVLPKFGRAQSPPRRHPEASARATASLRCVTPDPFRDSESRSTLRSPSPMPLAGNNHAAARQNKDPAQPQQRRPWTAVRESEGLTLEQEVRVRSRTVNSICRDIERRRHAARQQLKIRDLTERVQTQAKASMDREIEMRERLAREFPNFPIPLQKSWELALERRSQGGPLGFKDPSGMEEAKGGMPPAPRFHDESSNTTEEPLYLRYLRAKKYH